MLDCSNVQPDDPSHGRGGGMGLSPNDASGNVTVTFADAVVRVLGVELRGLCRLRQRAPDHQSTPVNFTKWDTQKAAGSCLAVHALLHARPVA